MPAPNSSKRLARSFVLMQADGLWFLPHRAIVAEEAPVNACPVGGDGAAAKIAGILGKEAKKTSGIVGYFTFETAHYHPAAGRDLFSVCQKWSAGSFADLVGISDHGSDRLSGGICIFKEDQKK